MKVSFFPTDSIVFESKLSQDLIMQHLKDLTYDDRDFQLLKLNSKKYFDGIVDDYEFKLKLNRSLVFMKGGYNAVAKGKMTSTKNTTTIKIEFEADENECTLIIVILSLFAIVYPIILITFLIQGAFNIVLLLFPVFVAVIIWAWKYNFRSQVKKMQSIFEEILL